MQAHVRTTHSSDRRTTHSPAQNRRGRRSLGKDAHACTLQEERVARVPLLLQERVTLLEGRLRGGRCVISGGRRPGRPPAGSLRMEQLTRKPPAVLLLE